MNKTGIIITILHRVNGDTTPSSHIVNPPYQHPAPYTPSPEQPLEESIDWEKRMDALDELERWIQILEDSKSRQIFQVINPYYIFWEKHADLKKSMESMIQAQNDPFDMIEVRLSR